MIRQGYPSLSINILMVVAFRDDTRWQPILLTILNFKYKHAYRIFLYIIRIRIIRIRIIKIRILFIHLCVRRRLQPTRLTHSTRENQQPTSIRVLSTRWRHFISFNSIQLVMTIGRKNYLNVFIGLHALPLVTKIWMTLFFEPPKLNHLISLNFNF